MEKRIIHSDNGTLRDLSVNLNKYEAGSEVVELVSSEDFIYIGSRLPFNGLFFKFDVQNATPSTPTVSYWDGDVWKSTVNILDETAGMTQSGHITWYPDLDESWHREHTNYNGETVDGLTDIVIYNLYWVRISFGADFDVGTSFSFMGDLFCDDDDLYTEFPDFRASNVLDSFETGKTDWEEQRIRASRILAQDLVDKGILKDPSQVLNRRDYIYACIQKTAELIYSSFGPDFSEVRLAARNEYYARLKKKIHRIDLNGNALEDRFEMKNKTGFLSR